ncbi:hypothetical protein BDV96DRAFT_586723 [Lophiotrema nucula]|uniref:Amine oxidase domain-containing protein n=1 Tax=Lophiotrema nucula TaxID=690887 RepID=A0A6A5YQV9_9PLEO|nr:hypothetical protein BDV96DRAFT_586723 [Lophiotrema nucula]
MPAFNNSSISYRSQWARGHLAAGVIKAHAKLSESFSHSQGLLGDIPDILKGPQLRDEDGQTLHPPPSLEPPVHLAPEPTDGSYKVAIIGAGAAGLFTGLIFDWLNAKCSLNVQYEILEANNDPMPNTSPRDYGRVGGRLFTWDEWKLNNPELPVYYDVGAMRYPYNPVMQRTFDLFGFLGMAFQDDLASAKPGQLVKYSMTNLVNPSDEDSPAAEYWCYNDKSKFGDLGAFTAQDAFGLNEAGDIPPDVLTCSPEAILVNAIQPFRDALKSNQTLAWDYMMSYDACTTRSFLEGNFVQPSLPSGFEPAPAPNYNFDTVEYLENFNGGTSWYDQALSETILESLDFDWNGVVPPYPAPKPKPIDWRCIFGGSVELAKNMEGRLTHQPTYGKRVTRIDLNDDSTLGVYTQDSSTATNYDAVFSSTTLRCLKMIDTSRLDLHYGVKQAMRSLDYGPSAKVGILFDQAWWRNPAVMGKNTINQGGIGHSDLTIRTCVYPSYNILAPDGVGKHVLLCTYTWQQDAERIGSLMCSTADPNTIPIDQRQTIVNDEAKLKELILRDLARLHAADGLDEDALYQTISSSYVDHYAHDWTHDPNFAGAFAFFKPQQFSQLWPKLLHPSNDFIIIGEVASPHHAWVVGALESAVVGVYHWLAGLPASDTVSAAKDLLTKGDGDPKNTCFWGLPDWMDVNTADWIGLLATLRKGHFLSKKNDATGKA